MKFESTLMFSTLFAIVLTFAVGVSAAPQKVACVGDSITFGATIIDRNKNSYPAQLQKLLGDQFLVKNFGVNSATLLKKGNRPYWQTDRFKPSHKFNPDIVIIKLGTNDTKPDNWKHISNFIKEYIELVKTYQELPSKPTVYICYPVPVYRTTWGINEKNIKEEMAMIKKIAEKTGASIIDLHKPMSNKESYYSGDKIHPNAKGAGVIAETIAGIIKK
jgi:lysophospholipase L1-like esterase